MYRWENGPQMLSGGTNRFQEKMVQQSKTVESSLATLLKSIKREENPKIYQTWESTVDTSNLTEHWSYAIDFKNWLVTKGKTEA